MCQSKSKCRRLKCTGSLLSISLILATCTLMLCLSACSAGTASRNSQQYPASSSSDSTSTSQSELGPETLMTKDELAMLQSFYPMAEIPDKITKKQEKILTEYRYLREYLRETYPGTEFKSPRLTPGGGLLSQTGELFRLTVGSDAVYEFVVSMDEGTGACSIDYDGYSRANVWNGGYSVD